jgi:hypothetical protein
MGFLGSLWQTLGSLLVSFFFFSSSSRQRHNFEGERTERLTTPYARTHTHTHTHTQQQQHQHQHQQRERCTHCVLFSIVRPGPGQTKKKTRKSQEEVPRTTTIKPTWTLAAYGAG